MSLMCPNCELRFSGAVCPNCNDDAQSIQSDFHADEEKTRVVRPTPQTDLSMTLLEKSRQTMQRRFSLGNSLASAPAETIFGGITCSLVLDCSGSMTSTGKIGPASEARREFSEGFGTEAQTGNLLIGGVLFSDTPRQDFPMSPVSEALREIKDLSASDCGGGTDIASALTFGMQEIHSCPPVRGRSYQVLFVLSDGEQTLGGDPVKVSADLKAQNPLLSICTVSFGEGADRSTLRAIASPGLDFDAVNGVDLTILYRNFQRAVSSSILTDEPLGDSLRKM